MSDTALAPRPCEYYPPAEHICGGCGMEFCRRRVVRPVVVDAAPEPADQPAGPPISPALTTDPRRRIGLVLTSIQASAEARELILAAYDQAAIQAANNGREEGLRAGRQDGWEKCAQRVLALLDGRYCRPESSRAEQVESLRVVGRDIERAEQNRHRPNAYFRYSP